MIAALYVQKKGAYFGLPDVDPWDEARDARLYTGPYVVIAHPPCSRWCRLAGLVEARWGYKRGDDGGCFRHALHAVRTHGGVLEHPAYSDAFRVFDLPTPPFRGGWVGPDAHGGYSCHVEQGRYGHLAKKATWLYCVPKGAELPALLWGFQHDHDGALPASWCGNVKGADGKYLAWRDSKARNDDARPRITKKQASATPPAFRAELLALARSIVVARAPAP